MLETDGQVKLLSILVPVYNWNVTGLARALVGEIQEAGLSASVDIHFFNDASSDEYSTLLRVACAEFEESDVDLIVHEVANNVGRSCARNELLARSSGRFLLFLDADVIPDDLNFIRNYLESIERGASVVCGGVSYIQCINIPRATCFYYKYSLAASVATPEVRNECPWAWIFTANMLVARDLMMSVPFDAGFHGYGYEDIEWGLRLHENSCILHIDNSVTHLGLLDKASLQRKYRESVRNLVHFATLHPVATLNLPLVRLGRRLSSLPAWMLHGGAMLGAGLFAASALGYRAEWVGMQSEKLFRVALAFKEDAVPGGTG